MNDGDTPQVGWFGLGKTHRIDGSVMGESAMLPENRAVVEPFILCKGGTLIWGDIEAARAQGRSDVRAYVLDADPVADREKLLLVRQDIIRINGKDW